MQPLLLLPPPRIGFHPGSGHPARPALYPPPSLRRAQIYFKIFSPDFWPGSRSSFGFLRNSGISKQISVPRWSSNLEFNGVRKTYQRQSNSVLNSNQPSSPHDLQTLVKRDLRFLFIDIIRSSSSLPFFIDFTDFVMKTNLSLASLPKFPPALHNKQPLVVNHTHLLHKSQSQEREILSLSLSLCDIH